MNILFYKELKISIITEPIKFSILWKLLQAPLKQGKIIDRYVLLLALIWTIKEHVLVTFVVVKVKWNWVVQLHI